MGPSDGRPRAVAESGGLSRSGSRDDGSGTGQFVLLLFFLLGGDDLPRVELHQHGRVRLKIFDSDGESEVIQDEELNLEMVELCQGETTDLCGMRI